MTSPVSFTPTIDPDKGVDLTREAARFVLDTEASGVPERVGDLARASILDGLGLALSGSVAESGEIVHDYLAATGVTGSGETTVIGTGLRAAPRFAAFANGVAIHADDYDDTQLAVAEDRVYGLLTHPTAPVLPSALAVAEQLGLSGADMLMAYLVGVDLECKIAEAISPRHYQHGFHATATCGTFGSAAAASRLRGLTVEQTQRALSIAGSQSAGLRENFGTMTKPFRAGRSSESGVVATDFARAGWSASPEILEAPRGFFQAAGGGYDEGAIRGTLGSPWTFDSPGVSIKPHPSGSLTHPGMTEMLRLIHAHDIRMEDVVRVRVGTNHNMPNALIHHRPVNELQAKFSMEFCMAILLLERRAGLNEFTDEVVLRPDVQEALGKVEFGVHPEAEADGYAKMTTIIDIELTDGRTVSGRAAFGKGSPADPMDYSEVAAKFHECAEFASWDRGRAQAIVDMVADIQSVADVRDLTALLQR